MKYRVYVTYTMLGYYDVEANSLGSAKDKVYNADEGYDSLPTNGFYVDDTLRIDVKATDEYNEQAIRDAILDKLTDTEIKYIRDNMGI